MQVPAWHIIHTNVDMDREWAEEGHTNSGIGREIFETEP